MWTQPHKFAKPVVNCLASGWTFGVKLYLYSGAPFSVTDSKIPAQVNSAGGVLTPLADLLVGQADQCELRTGRRQRALSAEDGLRHLFHQLRA